MSGLSIRTFDPARDDYAALAALWTAQYPDLPRDAVIWQQRDAEPSPGTEPWERVIALRAGRLVGMAEYGGCPTAGEPGQLQFDVSVADEPDADDVLDALYEALEHAARAHQPPLLVAYARDTQPRMVAFYERQGFHAAQQTASSELRAPMPAAHSLAAARTALAAADCELCTAATLAEADPAWARAYHALEVAVVADIPFLGPVRAEPFAQCRERLEDPERFNPSAVYVARERATGALVGVSQLLTYERIPGYAFAGLTGVLPSHRRRGIARALKQATIGYARAYGITRIVALNEIDNPMLTLNAALGFVRGHVQLTMAKRLDGKAASPGA
ncbi:MAG: GNAT family N-acetyltransferase [Planctomycetota bacterium]|nr:GNAT family N-acetyltransferase [Planctomycetota bacterium]